MKIIKIGTRGSELALYQANAVKAELEKIFPEYKIEIVVIKTKGDKILDVALSKIGDKGLFTKELEVSLLNHETDLAVHSLKDLPTELPAGLKLGGVLCRGEFRDALVSKHGKKLNELTENDVIATSSLRRKAQLLSINPNFKIVDIRGNVNSRLAKMNDGYCDAMIMAAAGLQRLNKSEFISEILDPEKFIPAVSQGAIAIEIRQDDEFMTKVIGKINDPATLESVLAERVFLKTMEGGCQIPVGCYTKVEGNVFKITGFISNIDGTEMIRDTSDGPVNNACEIALKMAMSFYEKGAKSILDRIRKLNNEEHE